MARSTAKAHPSLTSGGPDLGVTVVVVEVPPGAVTGSSAAAAFVVDDGDDDAPESGALNAAATKEEMAAAGPAASLPRLAEEVLEEDALKAELGAGVTAVGETTCA